MSTNFFRDNEDLQYYFEKGVEWEKLVRLTELNYQQPDGHESYEEAREFYKEILDLFGGFVATDVDPHVGTFDRVGVKLVDGEAVSSKEWDKVFKNIREMGVLAAPIPREFGGQNTPVLLYHFNGEMLARADVSAMTHYSFHSGIALAMLVYSFYEGSAEFDPEQMRVVHSRFGEFVQDIALGTAGGAMDITEPEAGSDMAMLKSKAVQDENGVWRVSGNKIFITSGHAKYHIVIARTEEDLSLGLDGLSLFVVKAYDDMPDGTRKRYVEIMGLEEKLGHHGSATCALAFDNVEGHLVGQRGDGFKLMLLLMNSARVGVGFECIGLMERALRLAKDYAAQRVSMGKTIDRHEMIAEMIEDMEIEIAAARALAMHAGFHEEYSQKLDMFARTLIKAGKTIPELGINTMDDVDRLMDQHKWEARRVTPLLKYLGGEGAVRTAQRSIQIHGGVGYTRDYGAEKLLRDGMVLPIYEGTSQIQALMAMKDNMMRIIRNPQAFVSALAQARWKSVSVKDPLERRVQKLRVQKLTALQMLIQRTVADKFKEIRTLPVSQWKAAFVEMDPKRDFSYAMLHADRLIQILIHSTVADMFWEQTEKHPERQELLERWLEKVEPKNRMLLEEIAVKGQRLLDKLAALEEAGEA